MNDLDTFFVEPFLYGADGNYATANNLIRLKNMHDESDWSCCKFAGNFIFFYSIIICRKSYEYLKWPRTYLCCQKRRLEPFVRFQKWYPANTDICAFSRRPDHLPLNRLLLILLNLMLFFYIFVCSWWILNQRKNKQNKKIRIQNLCGLNKNTVNDKRFLCDSTVFTKCEILSVICGVNEYTTVNEMTSNACATRTCFMWSWRHFIWYAHSNVTIEFFSCTHTYSYIHNPSPLQTESTVFVFVWFRKSHIMCMCESQCANRFSTEVL